MRLGSGAVAAVVLLCAGCKDHSSDRALAASGAPATQPSVVPPLTRALEIIRHGEHVELIALDGDRTELTEHPAAGDVVVPGSGPSVIATPVIASVVLTDEDERERVRAAALLGLGDDATAGWCFEPRHALRVRRDTEEATLALCYECAAAWLLAPNVQARFAINQGSSRALNEALALHHISF